MMLSVLVWLAMWGHAQAQTHWPVCSETVTADCIIEPPIPPKPAEHVIEIKTVRERHEVCQPDDLVGAYGCFGVIKELWIDGTKYGIIKGLD